MVGGVHMCCPALPTGGEVDDESFSWAVSILASGYLAVPLLFYIMYYFYHHTYFSLSYLQTLTIFFFNYK